MSLGELLMPLCSERLQDHLFNISLDTLSRVSTERVAEKAVPHIGVIELVAADDFATLYDPLYISMFSHAERERSDLIVDRLRKEFANARVGLAPYRVIGLRDKRNEAIGAAQFSVLMLEGGRYAIPYLQYIYVRQQNRRQDMAEVLHTLVLAIASADASKNNNREVPFTLFETEPSGHGSSEAARSNATQRAIIHTKAGATAIMLRRKNDQLLITPHVQPGLEVNDPPLSLVWAVRLSPAVSSQTDAAVNISLIGPALIDAYYQSLRDEGFPEHNICTAEQIFQERRATGEFLTMPLCDVVLHESHV